MAVALPTFSHYLPAKPFFTFVNSVIRYTVGIRVDNDLSRFSAIRLQSTPSVCDGRFVRKCSSITATKVSKATVLTECRETAMLVIDMQNDCVLPESPVRIAGAKAIVPSVVEAVSVARERGILVIWVVREHDNKGRDVELFRRHLYTDGAGPATQGSKGVELVEELVIEDGDYKLVKTRFSAFFATNLDLLLRSCGINNLVVVGIQTPNCIRQTAFDAVSLDYRHVTVITDATAAATPEIHLANIEDMKNIGVSTLTLQEWCSVDL
ncbi:putative inactive nicotinamidase At3g16190 isoform X2 [Carex rostrata]